LHIKMNLSKFEKYSSEQTVTMAREQDIENQLIERLKDLKYTYRPDIRDRYSLEKNFREKFESLNRVRLSDTEFARLRDEIINPDVFACSKVLREQSYFQREDGTYPGEYQGLVQK